MSLLHDKCGDKIKLVFTNSNFVNLFYLGREKEHHIPIICDGCKMDPIFGIRFKCKSCPDYDLCENCLAKNIHKEHKMHIIRTGAETQMINQLMIGNAIIQGTVKVMSKLMI